MNRKIKFRAWDSEKSIMYFPHVLSFVENKASSLVLCDDGNRKYIEHQLMQFTGLRDKNGVDVYEHDRNDDGDFVVFCESCNGWEFGAIDIPTGDIVIKCHKCDGNFFFEDLIDEFVVAGHIYETPGLL